TASCFNSTGLSFTDVNSTSTKSYLRREMELRVLKRKDNVGRQPLTSHGERLLRKAVSQTSAAALGQRNVWLILSAVALCPQKLQQINQGSLTLSAGVSHLYV
ncbi:hypothetical protein STEG23_007563, partial [Scotinomys teguina]